MPASARSLLFAALLAGALPASAFAGTDLILVPDSGSNRIWAFSAADGSIVTENFIAPDAYLTQPIQIVESGSGTFLITDEVRDALFEYSAQGVFLRELAGPKDGLDGAYGVCVRDGFAYITTGSVGKKIWRVALDGLSAPTLFADWTTIGDPRGIQPYGDGFLVGNSGDDDLEILSAAGVLAPTPFHDSDGITGIDFPQQIQPLAGGGWMVCGFSRPSGIFLYDAEGFEYQSFQNQLVTIPRGAIFLDNGDLLYTGGTRVVRLNPLTQATVDIVNQSTRSFRWLTRYTPAAPCPGDLNNDGVVSAADLAILLGAWGTATAAADLNGDGTVAAPDLALLLGAWGDCP